MSPLNYQAYTPHDVCLQENPRNTHRSRNSTSVPATETSQAGSSLLDTLNDVLSNIHEAKGHEDLIEHTVFEDFVAADSNASCDEPCLVAIVLGPFGQVSPSKHKQHGTIGRPMSSAANPRRDGREITIFTLRGK